jgi:hypothetical protein
VVFWEPARLLLWVVWPGVVRLLKQFYPDRFQAELGWLNSSLKFSSPREFELDVLLLEIVCSLRDRIGAQGYETAHLKVIGLWERFFGVANLVSSDSNPELSLP